MGCCAAVRPPSDVRVSPLSVDSYRKFVPSMIRLPSTAFTTRIVVKGTVLSTSLRALPVPTTVKARDESYEGGFPAVAL